MDHNVNLAAAKTFRAEVERDPAAARKQKAVEGAWDFDPGVPQFRATLPFGKGEVELTCELPPFAGGWGTSPDPLQYCLFGLAACYATTFASAAASEGVPLTSLRVKAENDLDLRKQLGLGKEPILQWVRFTVEADGAGRDELERVKRLADERCPGVECVTRSVPLETKLA